MVQNYLQKEGSHEYELSNDIQNRNWEIIEQENGILSSHVKFKKRRQRSFNHLKSTRASDAKQQSKLFSKEILVKMDF